MKIVNLYWLLTISLYFQGLERQKTPDDQNPIEIQPENVEMQEGHEKGRKKRNRGKKNWEKVMAAKRRKGKQS